MGRLIDIDVLFDYFGNDAINEITRSNIEYFVSEKGTLQAIPKDQYEARLKADLETILVDLQLEIKEYTADYLGTGDEITQAYADGLAKGRSFIQEKINALKGENT